MNRIMVVDDEAIQRRVLSNVIREALPDCEVIVAGNGKAALELARSQFFDAVITDIKMPIMDGFGFIEHMKEIAADTKIIILSGYRYFEYAQRAIQLGAFDYLLKPVNEESIGVLLQKVEDSIRKEKVQSMEQETIRKQLDSSMNVYYEHLLQEWIQSGITSSKQQELQRQFTFGAFGLVIVTKMDTVGSEHAISERMDELRADMAGILESEIVAGGRTVSFFSAEDKRSMITFLTGEDRDGLFTATTSESLQAFSRRLSEQYQMTFVIGVGGVHADLYTNAGKSYQEALEAARFRYFLDSERVILFNKISERIKPLHYDFLKDEQFYKENIRTMKSDAITKHTEDLFRRVLENGMPYPEQWVKSIVHLVFHIAPVIKDFMSEGDYQRILREAESRLSACESYHDCGKEFLHTLSHFMTIIQNNRTRKHENIVEKSVNYIDEHYMDDLSLDTVANQLFFSPNYLSSIFKNHLGVSFTKYLADIRLKKAVAMLDNRDRKVYEIAAKVGFRDEKYFYRVFKARFGVTPDEYRKNHALETPRD